MLSGTGRVAGARTMTTVSDNDHYDDGDCLFIKPCSFLQNINQYGHFFTCPDINNSNLNIFHCNIRSYNKNVNELIVFLDSIRQRLDIIVLTECWLIEGGEVGTHLDDFDLHWTDKKRNKNDGVVVYVRKYLSAAVRQVTLGDVFGVSLEFTLWKKHFNLLAVYRTFDSSAEIFIDHLNSYYDGLDKNKMCIFLGDINLDLLKDDTITDSYKNCMVGVGLVQCIDKPTRITSNSKSIIDHIFVRYCDITRVNAAIFDTSITDHLSTALTITGPSCTATTLLTPRTYVDHTLLTNNLAGSDWEAVMNCLDVNTCANVFVKTIKNCIDISKKLVQNKCTRFRKLKPWITVDLIQAIRKRDKMSKAVKKQPFNFAIRERFQELRRSLSNLINLTKRNYYREKIDQSGKNAKVLWEVVKELSGRVEKKDGFPIQKFMPNISPTNVDTHKNVANEFNNFFSSVGQNLANNIKSDGDPVVIDEDYRQHTCLTLQTVTEQDVVRLVLGLRGGSAPGHDGISAEVLKLNLHILCRPLCYLSNLSLVSGVYPDIFKLAKVIPIHKSEAFTDKNNFRPISLLSVLAKILEKIVKEQVVGYLHTNNLISHNQYGFRSDKNISDALFDVCRDINTAISNKESSILIFLDLKKAFDSVNRGKLLKKLEIIGVRGCAFSWFHSYLSDRRQVTNICGIDSDEMPLDYGVIQGSTLGPILFLIYINNISKLNISSKLFLFADDTLILTQGKSWVEVKQKALRDLAILKKWLDYNVLTLNISKTKFMPISLKNSSDYALDDLVIHSCGNSLNNLCQCGNILRVTSYKYLGIFFDNHMKWSVHIEYLKKRLRKFVFAFKELSYVLNKKEMKIAYYAYVQSLLSFGIIAWGGAYKTIMNSLSITQKMIIKVAFKKNRRFATDLLFQETQLLTIRQIFVKVLLIHIYKNFNNIYSLIAHSYNTRYSRNIGVSTISLTKTFSVTNCFYISQILYRNICLKYRGTELFNSPSAAIFKKRITQFVISLNDKEVDALIVTGYSGPA